MGQKIPLMHILLYESVRISNAMRSTLTHICTNTRAHTHTESLHKCWWFVCFLWGRQAWSRALVGRVASQIQEVCQKWTHQNRIPKQNNRIANNNKRRTKVTTCVACLFSVMVNGNTTGKIIMVSIAFRLRESVFMEHLGVCRWIRLECD